MSLEKYERLEKIGEGESLSRSLVSHPPHTRSGRWIAPRDL